MSIKNVFPFFPSLGEKMGGGGGKWNSFSTGKNESCAEYTPLDPCLHDEWSSEILKEQVNRCIATLLPGLMNYHLWTELLTSSFGLGTISTYLH